MTLPPGAQDAHAVGGGDINQAWRVVLADGSLAFVKTRVDAAPGEYAAEAAGLAWLAEPGCVRIPRVLAVHDDYLVLEWVDPGRLDGAGEEELGRGLARLHASGAPSFGGPQDDLRIGPWFCRTLGATTGRRSTLSAASNRWSTGPGCRRTGAGCSPGSVSVCRSSRARRNRRRGCTEICGAETSTPTCAAGRG
jgi:hypothetical protein